MTPFPTSLARFVSINRFLDTCRCRFWCLLRSFWSRTCRLRARSSTLFLGNPRSDRRLRGRIPPNADHLRPSRDHRSTRWRVSFKNQPVSRFGFAGGRRTVARPEKPTETRLATRLLTRRRGSPEKTTLAGAVAGTVAGAGEGNRPTDQAAGPATAQQPNPGRRPSSPAQSAGPVNGQLTRPSQ